MSSDLAAIGLTAAFSTALGQAGISGNVVADNRHGAIGLKAWIETYNQILS